MPVSWPNWALSERFFEVDFGQESTCTQLIRYADSVVYGSVSEGFRLRVYVVVNAEAIRG